MLKRGDATKKKNAGRKYKKQLFIHLVYFFTIILRNNKQVSIKRHSDQLSSCLVL